MLARGDTTYGHQNRPAVEQDLQPRPAPRKHFGCQHGPDHMKRWKRRDGAVERSLPKEQAARYRVRYEWALGRYQRDQQEGGISYQHRPQGAYRIAAKIASGLRENR